MSPPKDHYKTLGVAENATADEIKKSYRRLAKKNHPDATGGDKKKESRFKEISEAYETVGDEKKRADYDAQRRNPYAGGGGPGGFGGGSPFPGGGGFSGGGRRRVRVDPGQGDIGDIFGGGAAGGGAGGFSDLFADLFRGGGGGREAPPQPSRGADVKARVELELPLAALGGDLPLTVDGKRLTVKIPPGIEDGQTVRVGGHGQAGPSGSPAGDLLLEVHVKPHPQFRRHGADLEVDVPVGLDQAVLGAKVEVPTLEGHAQVSVPPASSSGLKLRLRGKGARRRGPAVENAERGDLYAVIQIHIPKDLPPKALELIQEFAKLTRP